MHPMWKRIGKEEWEKKGCPTVQMRALQVTVSRETEAGTQAAGSLETICLGQAITRTACGDAESRCEDGTEASRLRGYRTESDASSATHFHCRCVFLRTR